MIAGATDKGKAYSDPPNTKHWAGGGGGLKVIAGATDKGKAHSDPPNIKHWAGGLKVIAGATDKGEWEAHSDPPTTVNVGVLTCNYQSGNKD